MSSILTSWVKFPYLAVHRTSFDAVAPAVGGRIVIETLPSCRSLQEVL